MTVVRVTYRLDIPQMSGYTQLVIVFMYDNVIGCGQTGSAPGCGQLVRVDGYG